MCEACNKQAVFSFRHVLWRLLSSVVVTEDSVYACGAPVINYSDS